VVCVYIDTSDTYVFLINLNKIHIHVIGIDYQQIAMLNHH